MSKMNKPGTLRRWWSVLRRPSARYSILTLLVLGLFGGIIFWGGFNTAMEASNSLSFCISCHEMRDTVYQEYQETVHYQNRTGVRATCADCHVPRPWGYKLIRKVQATNELFHKVMGTVDTPEKFEAKRVELAKRVWASMRASNSRECRNCHSIEGMTEAAQTEMAWQAHEEIKETGETCIDCHQGIAHKDVSEFDDS
jgi:cytochrome c-type protein NapC